MSDATPILNIGVGGGTLLLGVRVAWPVFRELLRQGKNGGGSTASYLEGKDVGLIVERLETIGRNTAPIAAIAQSNAQILDGLGAAQAALEKHENAAVSRAEALSVRVIAAQKLIVSEVVKRVRPTPTRRTR